MSQFKLIIYGIGILSSTIIGVGLFSLPYITMKTGLGIVFGYFLVLGFLVIIVHLYFAKITLQTPDFKRFPGFAKFYLGKKGEFIAYISTILGTFGALLAYLIVGGEFLEELLSPIFGGTIFFYTLFYFFLGSLLIFFGIKAIAKVELWGLILFFLVLFLVFLKGFSKIKLSNFFLFTNFDQIFLPYGAILFSLWGASLIPEVEEMLGKGKNLLFKIVIISILASILLYLFFIYLILGIAGVKTTEFSLTGLKEILDSKIIYPVLFFGFLTTFTSFTTLGLTLKKVFWYDLKIPKNSSFIITCFIPLILFLLGMKNFIFVISFIGGVMLGIDGILILLMYKKIKPKNFLVYPLILIFLGGIVYEVIYFLR